MTEERRCPECFHTHEAAEDKPGDKYCHYFFDYVAPSSPEADDGMDSGFCSCTNPFHGEPNSLRNPEKFFGETK